MHDNRALSCTATLSGHVRAQCLEILDPRLRNGWVDDVNVQVYKHTRERKVAKMDFLQNGNGAKLVQSQVEGFLAKSSHRAGWAP